MTKKGSQISENETGTEGSPKFLNRGAPTGDTIDLDSIFTADVTMSGSFNVRDIHLTSFARLLNAIPLPVVLVDRFAGVKFANEGWGKIVSEYHSILNTPFPRLFPEPETARKVHAIIEAVFSDRKTQTAEGWLLIRENRIWGRMSFRSLRLGSERFVLVPVEDLTLEKRQVAIQEAHQRQLQKAHDELEKRVRERTAELVKYNRQLQNEIAERERVERALRSSEERFSAIFEAAEDLVFVKDASLKYTHINPAMLKLLGVGRSTVIGKTDEELFSPQEARISREVERRVLRGQTVELEHTVKFRGPTITCNFMRVPLKDESGKINGLCGIGRDVTERKRRGTEPESDGPTNPLDDLPSEIMRTTLREVRLTARTDSICLFLGESGSGKDFLAKYLHDQSLRAGGPFFSINCAALAQELAESELFGHEAGAFTGSAGRKRGLLELAEGGTLLLNEIGELSPQVQAKLLTFLDTQSFTRVGGEKQISVNARLVAATNRNLAQEVEEGNFRKDLFFRLNVITIRVPPLRERIEDLPILVDTIVESLIKRMGLTRVPSVGAAAMERLKNYHWPGNIRELRNVLERALILSDSGRVEVDHLDLRAKTGMEDLGQDLSAMVTVSDDLSLPDALQEAKRILVTNALKRMGGNVTGTARVLGISRDSLNHHIKFLGIRDKESNLEP